MRLRYLIFPLLIVSLAIVFACGGDDDEDVGDDGGGEPTTEAPAGDDDSGDDGDDAGDDTSGGDGGATLTIGGETWDFPVGYCAFSPEESQNERVSFTMGGFGEVDGARVQWDATIQDPDEQGRYEGDGVIHSLTLNDIDDFQNPSIGWSSVTLFGSAESQFLNVDGKHVTAETTFDDELTDDLEEVPGTLDATCP